MSNENGDGEAKRWPRLVENVADVPPAKEKSTFMAFGSAIQAGDLEKAGQHLTALMDLSEEQGLAAAKFFQKRMQTASDGFESDAHAGSNWGREDKRRDGGADGAFWVGWPAFDASGAGFTAAAVAVELSDTLSRSTRR